MRRIVLLALLLAGCGGGAPRENQPRPPVQVTLTAAVHADRVQVSPASIGAGRILLIVSNQSGAAQTVTFETDELAGEGGGTRASSAEIAPRATGRLALDAREGTYSVHTQDDDIRAARITIGPSRPSAQNDLLLP